MTLKIDHEADALYLSLKDDAASESEEIAPGIVVDYGANGEIIGIEMLYISKRAPGIDTQRLVFETIPVGAA